MSTLLSSQTDPVYYSKVNIHVTTMLIWLFLLNLGKIRQTLKVRKKMLAFDHQKSASRARDSTWHWLFPSWCNQRGIIRWNRPTLEVEKLLIMWIPRSEAANPCGEEPGDNCRKGTVSLDTQGWTQGDIKGKTFNRGPGLIWLPWDTNYLA